LFSRRTRRHSERNSLSLALQAARGARPIVDLTGSNPTCAALPYDSDAIVAAMGNARQIVYSPDPLGDVEARRALVELWHERGVHTDVGRILLTASTSEAYAFALKLFCDAGDTVLVPRPSYPLFEQLANAEGVELRYYRLLYDGAWHIDFDSIRRARTPKTRALLVVNPNNPTGSHVAHSEIGALAELGIPLVSDEVFGSFPIDARALPTSALSTPSELCVALDGLSKLAGLPQAKIAWMTLSGCDDRVAEAMSRLELLSDTFLSVGGAVQRALPDLLRHRFTAHDAILARVRRNHRALGQALDGSALTLLHCEAGWSAVLRLPAVRDEDEWAMGLLAEADVAVQPGWLYDFEGGPFVVLSLVTPEAVFDEGVSRLGRFVERVIA
jgi:aspartate/methionine/tyrosine aminotransferase